MRAQHTYKHTQQKAKATKYEVRRSSLARSDLDFAASPLRDLLLVQQGLKENNFIIVVEKGL